MRQTGFGLVELMIGLVLGMIVIGAALGVYIGTFGANSSQMKYSRVNNDLRTVMTQITRDMRRAEHNNWLPQLAGSGTYTNVNYVIPQTLVIGTDSVVINYDLNGSGSHPDANERFGFAWEDENGDGQNDTVKGCVGSVCDDDLDAWPNLVDPSVVRIALFQIENISSPMINLTGPGTADVTVPVYAINIRGVLVTPDCPAPNCMTGQACPTACIVRDLRETVRLRNPILAAN